MTTQTRMIFKRDAARPSSSIRVLMCSRASELRGCTNYAKAMRDSIANNALALLTVAARPAIPIDKVKTRTGAQHEHELAKSIAEGDGVMVAIVYLISTVELFTSFLVHKGYEIGQWSAIAWP